MIICLIFFRRFLLMLDAASSLSLRPLLMLFSLSPPLSFDIVFFDNVTLFCHARYVVAAAAIFDVQATLIFFARYMNIYYTSHTAFFMPIRQLFTP